MVRRRAPPRLFRILVPAFDLARSRRFYEDLLGVAGREVAPGRVYFRCGSVIFGVLDYSRSPSKARPRVSEAIYFATGELEAVHLRARRLKALAPGFLHGDRRSPLGQLRTRPWGERSFYARDPAGNELCFVAEGTRFVGSASQISALRRAGARSGASLRSRSRSSARDDR